MKDGKFAKKALLGLAAGLCLFGSELSAWQRTAMDNCKKTYDSCSKDADNCKMGSAACKKQKDACSKAYDTCKKQAEQKDQDSFLAALSAGPATKFKGFSADKKKQAMDMADKNKMTPDTAVNKVSKM